MTNIAVMTCGNAQGPQYLLDKPEPRSKRGLCQQQPPTHPAWQHVRTERDRARVLARALTRALELEHQAHCGCGKASGIGNCETVDLILRAHDQVRSWA